MKWDREETKRLKVERQQKIRSEMEKRLASAAEREALLRSNFVKDLIELVNENDADGLESALEREASDSVLEDRAIRGTASSRDVRGNTLLSIAAWKGHKEVTAMLLRRRRHDPAADDLGDTDEENVRMRRVFGVSVDCRDQKGWSPLHIATFHGHKDVVVQLLEAGADPRLRNAFGKDAFDLARLTRQDVQDVSLMRWYDAELLQKDIERVEKSKSRHGAGCMEQILKEWREKYESSANVLGASRAVSAASNKKETETTTTTTEKRKTRRKGKKTKKKTKKRKKSRKVGAVGG